MKLNIIKKYKYYTDLEVGQFGVFCFGTNYFLFERIDSVENGGNNIRYIYPRTGELDCLEHEHVHRVEEVNIKVL